MAEQLDSILAQDHKNIHVWASDDASSDKTKSILENYQSLWGKDRFFIYTGPRKGFAANFLSLICRKDIHADFFAYSDQDDIWKSDKLSRAVEWLEGVSKEVPALYCSRTQIVDEFGGDLAVSPSFNRPSSFANALVQNIASGNTMVMNKAAFDLLRGIGEVKVASHDWWSYIVVSGLGVMSFMISIQL